MFSVSLTVINFVFAFVAGVVLAAVFGYEYWLLTFIVGFVLWNVVAFSFVLLLGFIVLKELEGGK